MTAPLCPVCHAPRVADHSTCPICLQAYPAVPRAGTIPTTTGTTWPDSSGSPSPVVAPPAVTPPRIPDQPSRAITTILGLAPRTFAIGVAAVVALVIGAVLLTLALSSTPRPDTHTAADNESATGSSYGEQVSTDTTQSARPAAKPTTGQAVVNPTTTGPALPRTTTPIDLRAIASEPDLQAVATLLDTYFTGVNDHDAERAASVFAPGGAIDADDPDQVDQFRRGISTTHDDDIRVVSVRPGRTDGHPAVFVRVEFRSTQAARFGPKGQRCTRWALTYSTVPNNGGGLSLLRSRHVVSRGC